MLTRRAVIVIGFVMVAPAAAEEMSLEQAHGFVIGKLFAVNCFDGDAQAMGRVFRDGSVIGTVQFRATGPERSGWLPPGTLKVKGKAICASLEGLPLTLLRVKTTSDYKFRAWCGASIPPIAISSAFWIEKPISPHGRPQRGCPLQLHPCTAGVQEQC